MIYTAKRDSENWIILDGENVTISKAKLQFKNNNVYGKIVIINNQYELLYNPLAFKNNRPRVNIFKGKKNENDAVYKSFKFDKKYGLYRYYQLRLDKHSYYSSKISKFDKSTGCSSNRNIISINLRHLL